MAAASLEIDWMEQAGALVESENNLHVALGTLRDMIGVDHLVYHTSRLGFSPSADPFVILTYNGAWIKRYVERNYLNHDPVLREGFLRSLPFDWKDIEVMDAHEAEMLSDAAAHGVGPHGLSIPVRNSRGHRGLFSVTSQGPAAAWADFKRLNIEGLSRIAHRIHKRVVGPVLDDDPKRLTGREIECLRWVAAGKEASDIALILDISKFTVRDHLKSARAKLDCVTSSQAVSKAVKLGFIDFNLV